MPRAKLTKDQRHIKQLEETIARLKKHAEGLARANNDKSQRIEELMGNLRAADGTADELCRKLDRARNDFHNARDDAAAAHGSPRPTRRRTRRDPRVARTRGGQVMDHDDTKVPAEVPLVAPGQGKSEYQTRRDAAWWAIAVAVIVAAVVSAGVLA